MEEASIDPTIARTIGSPSIVDVGKGQNVLINQLLQRRKLAHDNLFILLRKKEFEDVFFAASYENPV